MRFAAAIALIFTSALAFAKVEDKPVITPELMVERWISSWTQSEVGLAVELQNQRALMLRLIHHFLTDDQGGEWMLLMREEPDSELSDSITDFVRMNTGIMRELTLDQLFRELALQGDLAYLSGHNLSDSGVTLPAMKEAFRLYLRSIKSDLTATVLKVNMEDLRLSSHPIPEYQLIFKHMITMLRQENVKNFRVVVSTTPDAWNFVMATHELAMPLLALEDQERLQVIDGSKLEITQSCASLIEEVH